MLGERGMLVADTLTADLTFYENGVVASEWTETQALRGVSEGDMTRYALARREPLLAELEAFCDLLAGDDDPRHRDPPGGPRDGRLRRGGPGERRRGADRRDRRGARRATAG